MTAQTDEATRTPRRPRAAPPPPERVLTGTAVSPGIAVGTVFLASEPEVTVTRRKIAAADIAAQTARFDAAVAQSRQQLLKLRGRLAVLPEDSQQEIAPLLDAYLQMVGQSRLLRGVRQRIADLLLSAETAVLDTSEEIAASILALPAADDDPGGQLRRAEEVREIARRLLRNLTHTRFHSFAHLPEGTLLVCERLRPADVALLDPSRLAGVAAEEGGGDSHSAVMLRALSVPAVLGVSGLLAAATAGAVAVLDGSRGLVTLNPGPSTLTLAQREVTAFARRQQKLARLRRLPAVTHDGTAVELQANLGILSELARVAQAGAAGIGLLRSEFLFLDRETLPDERDLEETYRTIIEAMEGDPVTIRLLDWSGEKDLEALHAESAVAAAGEPDPAFGLRGIRLLLRHPELLQMQLAAILRASRAGPVRVLVPMVTTVQEVRATRDAYARVIRRLRTQGARLPEPLPPLGIMIETPGAALAADALAREVGFFAIGTNDLTMYTLAASRGGGDVTALYDPLHPAVLRLVQFAVEAALRARIGVSICGEMAANPEVTPLLLGLGLRSFSMNASAVPVVKQVVRGVSIDRCVALAAQVMAQCDRDAIHALIAAPPARPHAR
jgi:phosphotransferase system enzyme I (PtsI)